MDEPRVRPIRRRLEILAVGLAMLGGTYNIWAIRPHHLGVPMAVGLVVLTAVPAAMRLDADARLMAAVIGCIVTFGSLLLVLAGGAVGLPAAALLTARAPTDNPDRSSDA